MTLNRRKFASRLGLVTMAGASLGAGCVPQFGVDRRPEMVWGKRGLSTPGKLLTPRAMTISPTDELYIVDKSGRIQVYNANGDYLRGWRTPMIKQGKPTGLGWGVQGDLLVADTHYFRVLHYSSLGELNQPRTIGGEHGDEPGQFHFVTDVVQNAQGTYFVGQYGQIDQIQEFDPQGQYVRRWGSTGSQPGQFSRPQGLLVDEQGLLWVADACNHRLQVFDVSGSEPQLVHSFGSPGHGPGQLQYPYGIVFDTDGTLLVAEYGNHRVQRFSRDGQSIECWGGPGTEEGQFRSPWALILDSKRKLYVLDTGNDRVQRFQLG